MTGNYGVGMAIQDSCTEITPPLQDTAFLMF